MPKDTSPLDPQRRSLHAILRAHLPSFLRAHALPAFVRDELEGYIDCGVLGCGCAVYECKGCGLARVTALSCKGRGFCPRCLGRRMSEGARDLVQRVLPHVRIRQWTFSLPFVARVRLAFDHDRVLALWRIAHAEIDRRYRRLARKAGIAAPHGGSLLVIHRAGSDLKVNLHFHSLFLDGCYVANGQFWTAPAPSAAEVEKILARIILRAERLFGDDVQREPDDDEQAIERAYALSTRGERHGPEALLTEEGDPHDFGVQLPTRRKARLGEWDLDAEVAVDEHDRERLEHLCRYLLRPPLALDRLTLLDDGRVCIELRRAWADRTTHVTMSPDAFIARLATLVPRPRRNTTVYFGVLAANATGRHDIVPCPENERGVRPDSSWASLMKYSYGLDVLSCTRCGERLQFVDVVRDREKVRELLERLALWTEQLPLQPARGPPDEHESCDFF